MKVISYFLLVWVIFSSCEESGSKVDSKEEEIVIVYNDSLQNKFKLLGSKLFSFGDDHLIKEYQVSDKSKIRIKSAQKKVDVTYTDSHGRVRNYLFSNGDSLELKLKNDLPIIEALGGGNVHLNLDNSLSGLHSGYLTPSEVFFSDVSSNDNVVYKILNFDYSEEIKASSQHVLLSLDKEQAYLDSLHHLGLIEEHTYTYFHTINYVEKCLVGSYIDGGINVDKVLSCFPFLKDTSTFLTPYISFLRIYNSDLSLRRESISNLFVFMDSVAKLEVLPDKLLNNIFYTQLDESLDGLSVSQGIELTTSFPEKVTPWKENLYRKHLLDGYFDKEWHVQDKDGKKITFGNLLNTQTYDMVIVDIWAGWCKPCIQAFPKLHELVQRNPEVGLIYLSLDHLEENWHWAEERFLNPKFGESYYIGDDSLNRANAVAAFGISMIPRYLVFNSSGELLHKKAQYPFDSLMTSLLND